MGDQMTRTDLALPLPLIRGRDLIQKNIKPSPKFKEVLDVIYERQLAGEFTDRDAALTAALAMFD